MRESCTYGSVRGARSNARPYRDLYFLCIFCVSLYFLLAGLVALELDSVRLEEL